ncbi:MAG: FAD-dependent oxidoreductase [Ignavibacteriae bacterium]|nr:MAG: FAD-dependent oxidoreductase [Ignavibacteriota bacterium]
MGTRRDFIKLVMLGSGATYALGVSGCRKPGEMRLLASPKRTHATPQFQVAHAYLRDRAPLPAPYKTESCDVVIVGAGLSGLTAAVELERQGKRVILVESESRPGGAGVQADLAGGRIPLGNVYFVERTEALDSLIRFGGVEPVICPPDGYDLGRGEVVRDLWTDETLDRVISNDTERDGMKRFRDQIVGLGDNVPAYPLENSLTPELASLDVSAEEWIKGFKSQTLLTVLNSYSRSSMGALLLRTNIYCLQNFYSGELGSNLNADRFTFPGGPGALTKAVGDRLTCQRLDHVCVRVTQDERSAQVDCVDESGKVVRFTASQVIMASQKFQAPYLIPDMPTSQVAACKALSYAPYMTLHIVSDVPLTESDVYDTWNLTSEFETDVVNPGSVPGMNLSKHVSSLFVPMDEFARGQLQNPELFARRSADIIERFVGTRTPEQQASIREVYCWGWGHGLVIPTPGSHSGIAQAASARHGRIHFANTDCDAAPAIENACYHGLRAAQDVGTWEDGRS